jgi:hypothetical protein
MTDAELIKRLREADTYNKKYYAVDPLHQEAADRIEELVEERDTARRLLGAATQMQTETQAKLAKAVEALRETTQMLSQCTFTIIRMKGQYFERHEVVDKARAALADLGSVGND